MAMQSIYLTIVLAPLIACIVAGLFGKAIGHAILVVVFRERRTIEVEDLDSLQG